MGLGDKFSEELVISIGQVNYWGIIDSKTENPINNTSAN